MEAIEPIEGLVAKVMPVFSVLAQIKKLTDEMEEAGRRCTELTDWMPHAFAVLQQVQEVHLDRHEGLLESVQQSLEELLNVLKDYESWGCCWRLLCSKSKIDQIRNAKAKFDEWERVLELAVNVSSAQKLQEMTERYEEVFRRRKRRDEQEADLEMAVVKMALTREEVQWSTQDSLGQGGSAIVFRGTHDGDPVAVKVVILNHLPKGAQEKVRQHVLKQVAISRGLQSNFVCRIYGILNEDSQICLVMPLARCSVRQELDNMGAFPERRATSTAQQVAKGMKYLHGRSIAHQDLKASNILIMMTGDIQVADFDLAVDPDAASTYSSVGVQHVSWQAPEVLGRRESDTRGLDRMRSDVYSYGVVIFEILTAQVPWRGLTPAEVERRVKDEDKRPDSLVPVADNALAGLMRRCWHKDPAERPGFQQVVGELL